MKLVLLLSCALLYNVVDVLAHARMRVPASRASMWRDGYTTPPDYTDNEGFCGGFAYQWEVSGGKCGICGDAYGVYPRPHEAPGGIWGNTGIVTGEYAPGQWIDVSIEVTTQHLGHFIFKVCPNNNFEQDPDQDCFDSYGDLEVSSGGTQYPMLSWDSGVYNLQVKLPDSLTCDQCIFQFSWTTGNRWGDCGNGTSVLGCGPQETFMACSDISINYPK